MGNTRLDKPDGFENYLLAEYDNIAQAHFKTIDTISEFFKHYLTIVTIPFAILAVALNLDAVKVSLNTLNGSGKVSITGQIVSILFISIGVVGFMVFWYILNLRWDSLLYARTVNGIRKHFYDLSDELSFLKKERIRVLPNSPQLPEYREFYFFGPVVIAFMIFNTLYFGSGLYGLFFFAGMKDPLRFWPFCGLTLIFAVAHFSLYRILANRREYGKQRFHIFGIDIDGVLNLHREQFSKILEQKTGKRINPEDITLIPVRDCEHLGVSQEDEFEVFNDPEYWTSMPPDPNARKVLRSLQNSYKLQIHIFTSRPWPIRDQKLSENDDLVIKNRWKDSWKRFSEEVYAQELTLNKVRRWFNQLVQLHPYRIMHIRTLLHKRTLLEKITEGWLDKYDIPHNRLVVEYGSEDASDPNSHVYNRFYAARKMPIKYFVEDDLRKANKLSYICDIVFLINHPYNQSDDLPKNVIRVDSWNNLLQLMREIV